MRVKHIKKFIFTHLNINSPCNKLVFLIEFVKGKVDILMISETKTEESFPLSQFKIDSYITPFCLDRNNSGGVLGFLFGKIYRQN